MMRPLLAGLVLLAPVAVRAQDAIPGPKISFPDVKGFEREKPHVYKDKTAGYSIGYTKGDLIATVYVYNMGRAKIAAGPDSDAVKAEMLDSVAALEANRKNGRYKSISPVEDKIFTLGTGVGAPKFRFKQYEVDRTKDGPAFTELYLTGYKDHFLKVRATYSTDNAAASKKALRQLLDALAEALE